MNAFVWHPRDFDTRLCQARDCPNDAIPGWPVCERHDRLHKQGKRVTLHETPISKPAVLLCNGCHQWLPDEAFPPKPVTGTKSDGGRSSDRRGRYCYCHACNDDPIQAQIRSFNDARKNQARRQASA